MPSEANGALPPRIPIWLLYWLAISSFGIYLLFWVHRIAKLPWGARERSPVAVWWALGTMAPPVCMALLHNFGQRARHELRARGGLRLRGVALPPLLYLGFLLAGAFSPLRHFVLTPLFLLPLPFLLVQRFINRVHTILPETSAPQRLRVRAWHWVGASGGTLAVGLALWVASPGLTRLFIPPAAAGATIASLSERFQVTLPGDGWRRLSPGSLGDPESDLELQGPGLETWLIAYTAPRAQRNLDMAVENRRAIIEQFGSIRSFVESRRFLEGSDFVVVSTSDYQTQEPLSDPSNYVILTVEMDDHIVELVGYTADPVRYLDDLRELVQSFTTLTEEPAP